jgi:hypothetical protein
MILSVITTDLDPAASMRICAGLASLADLASPVPEASCAALGGASLPFSLPGAARPSSDRAPPVWAAWSAVVGLAPAVTSRRPRAARRGAGRCRVQICRGRPSSASSNV